MKPQAAIAALLLLAGQQPPAGGDVPSAPLAYGGFTARFAADRTFTLQGDGWPPFSGTWTREADQIVLDTPGACKDGPGRYRLRSAAALSSGAVVGLDVVTDACTPRRMIVDKSSWRPAGTAVPIPERRITRAPAGSHGTLPPPASANGSWPSFRGTQASGVAPDQHLPDTWDGASGRNIAWRTPIPGLAHSSPIVWGDRVFVTTAISSDSKATFKPGLYGDGDASDDQSAHRWMLYALDKRTGRVLWERTAYEGPPLNKRHIKSTYASATPATDGRIVVAWFGSQGVHAFDVAGNPLWNVSLGRVDMGAYDIPSYEWGPASSPIIWNGLVILQCDTQADSFLLALKADSGEIVWKTPRQELPSWGTPTVAATASGPVLVTNASNYARAYDPRTGQELWRIGPTSKITAPTPIFSDDLFIVASGRAPERPIVAVRATARGDVTPSAGESSTAAVAWTKTARGPYMPTPLVYDGVLYVLANNGVFDAYDLKTGAEIYRQRLETVGSGFSASPVAADGKIYLSNEDGDMLVVAAGRTFRQIAANAMGDLLMATPALSDGLMYVRTSRALFAIGQRTP